MSNDITAPDMMNRREFITLSARVGLAAGSLVIAANVLAACGDPKPPRYVEVGKLTDFPAGQVVGRDVTDANGGKVTIFIQHTATATSALSSICTHNHCTVQWVASQDTFNCPCHGGIYNRDGTVKAGPPPAPLATLQTKIEGDTLSVLI